MAQINISEPFFKRDLEVQEYGIREHNAACLFLIYSRSDWPGAWIAGYLHSHGERKAVRSSEVLEPSIGGLDHMATHFTNLCRHMHKNPQFGKYRFQMKTELTPKLTKSQIMVLEHVFLLRSIGP